MVISFILMACVFDHVDRCFVGALRVKAATRLDRLKYE